MQPLSITIDVKAQDIPALICEGQMGSSRTGYLEAIGQAVAEALGFQEYLSSPGSVDEVRRKLWQKAPVI